MRRPMIGCWPLAAVLTLGLWACSSDGSDDEPGGDDGAGEEDGAGEDDGGAEPEFTEVEGCADFEPLAGMKVSPDDLQPARCGYMTVPENRGAGSGTIELPVIVLESSAGAEATPLVLVNGGPGSPSLGLIDLAQGFRADRDVVMVNERGAAYSRPHLLCPELDELRGTILGDDGVIHPIPEEDKLAARVACAERLRGEADLDAWNMLEMTSDVDESLAALGYDKYSVWGVSFGTLMAQALAKRFPDRVESIVLDSPASLYEDEDFPSLSRSISINVLSAIPDALELVFAECAADPTCNESYPDLAQTMSDTLAALEKKPLDFTTERDGATYTWTLTPTLLYRQLGNSMGAELIGFIPRVIHAVARRVQGDPVQDEEALAALQQTIEGSFDPGADGAAQTDALFGTVSCSSWNYVSEKEVEAAAEDPFVRAYALDLVLAGVRDCKEAWQVPGLEEVWPEMLTPLESDTLPALILPGKFDANIPPLTGELIASQLEHAYLHVTPDRGHVVINECTIAMTQAFLRDPTVDPDASCLDELAIAWQ